ncbi:MAG: MATE family efflux transporter [Lachnospiraceae bacterium]|nr:MATE family efflux transporter [Lachnospiraceae bacterium]
MRANRKKTYEIDMTHGPLTGKILLFTLPLMASSILQLLFNAADIIIVRLNAVNDYPVAAIGSTGSLINMLVALFMGLGVGVNVLVAHFYAIDRKQDVSETVHTAITSALAAGCFLLVFGIVLCRPLLTLMDSPAEVIDLSTLYMRIYFAGMPVNLLYNIGAAVLRAVGDTRRPLYYLTLAGILNVGLNLIFVLVFHMGVAGVALATILSQALSALLVVRCLMRTTESYRFEIRQCRITGDKLKRMLQIGLPAGLQGTVFSISNVLIQSSINSFGALAMAGSAAGANIEGFVYVAMNAFHQACVTFTSANFGALDAKRIDRVLINCLLLVSVTGIALGNIAYFFAEPLLSIYNKDPQAIAVGITRMSIICRPYFICGVMDVICGSIRGLGASVMPMIVSVLGACGLRILWIVTVFSIPDYHSLFTLFLSYPITWSVTALVHLICFFFLRRHLHEKFAMRRAKTA